MSKTALIIGGGHNGLVCAAYLAKAGMNVTVLERRPILGGAAVTEEFHPGFRNSVCSYTVSLLHPKVIQDLNLYQHGLQILPRNVNNLLPLSNGDSFASIPGQLESEIARFSKTDVQAMRDYDKAMSAIVAPIREAMLQTPPAVHDIGLGDVLKLLQLTRTFKSLSLADKQFLLSLFGRSAGEMLDDFFETDALKAMLGFDAVVGNFASPYQQGSAYVLLHHLLGEVHGEVGRWGHAVGGMGAISDAIAQEAEKAGVRFVTDCAVDQIVVERGRAVAVLLADNTTLRADLIAASVNPVLLYQHLLPSADLDQETRQHFSNYRNQSGTFRMNVALSELPDFQCRKVPDWEQAGIIMAPDLQYMDQAYQEARSNDFSSAPIVEMLIPSTVDNSLAPKGQHVASLFCQHFDPALGDQWLGLKDQAMATVINTVDAWAPNFKNSIIASQALSPWDLETEFGLVGGDIFHGRLTLDQLFTARPKLGLGQYRTEFKGLYLCGSGTHPGGGVSGIPGHNAAREILRDH